MSNFANATANAVETVSISSAKKASSGYKTNSLVNTLFVKVST